MQECDIMAKLEIRTCKHCGETELGIVREATGYLGNIWVCPSCNKQENTLTFRKKNEE